MHSASARGDIAALSVIMQEQSSNFFQRHRNNHAHTSLIYFAFHKRNLKYTSEHRYEAANVRVEDLGDNQFEITLTKPGSTVPRHLTVGVHPVSADTRAMRAFAVAHAKESQTLRGKECVSAVSECEEAMELTTRQLALERFSEVS